MAKDEFTPKSQQKPMFPSMGTPFISCYIGSDLENGIHIGNTHLQKSDGFYDPRFIKSIQVTKQVPDNASGIFRALLGYIRKLNTPKELTAEEKLRFGKKAEEAQKEQLEKYKKAQEEAPKDLEQALKGVADRYAHNIDKGGVKAIINLSLISDMSLMNWFYNYSVSQKMKSNLRLQYGILAGKGQQMRVSPIYEGIITSATIRGLYDMSLEVQFLPSKVWGWSPEDFNRIFQDKERDVKAAKKHNNGPDPYEEGQTVVSVNEKTRRYSNVVRRIAEGLKWNIGRIEPTTLMPEGVLLTVDNFDDGPLAYIQAHFCGILDQKDSNGKSVKAGAVSENGHFCGYTAYFEPDENKRMAFYYVPSQAVVRKVAENTKIFNYYVRGLDQDGQFTSEVLDFSIDPIDLRTTMFNVEKGDGKGETNLPIIDNNKKEVGSTSYTNQTNVTTAGAATAKKVDKGASQNPGFRNTLGGTTKYALDAYEANEQILVANTWTSQMKATLKILFDDSVHLLQVIYVCVICPMNDSTSIQGNINTKKVIHPSSGMYRIMKIEDNLGEGVATTTLSLIRVSVTQEEVNQINSMLQANAEQAKKEREKLEQKQREAESHPKNSEQPEK